MRRACQTCQKIAIIADQFTLQGEAERDTPRSVSCSCSCLLRQLLLPIQVERVAPCLAYCAHNYFLAFQVERRL